MEKIREAYIGHSGLIIKNGRIDLKDLNEFGITAQNFDIGNLCIIDTITVQMYRDGSTLKIDMTENNNEVKVVS